MDILNKLGPMRTLVQILDFCESCETELEGQFSTNYTASDASKLPLHIKPLYETLKDPMIYPAIKIFILKLIINRPKIFKPFRIFFNEFLLNYLCLDTSKGLNGGKGFHYFMRDVCMTLIIWNDEEGEVLIDSTVGKLQELSYKSIFNLSSSLAHQTKSIFVINVELFQKVCSLLRKNLIMDEQLIVQMLKA